VEEGERPGAGKRGEKTRYNEGEGESMYN